MALLAGMLTIHFLLWTLLVSFLPTRSEPAVIDIRETRRSGNTPSSGNAEADAREVLAEVNTWLPKRVTRTEFLSVALDSGLIRHHWKRLNFRSSRILTLASALSPAYLRCGGTAEDVLLFNSTATSLSNSSVHVSEYIEHDDGANFDGNDLAADLSNFTMTADDWNDLNGFAADTGWKLIFGLNVLLRRGKRWDPGNAKQLLEFSEKRGFNLDFELGNEPDAFPHVFGRNLSAEQLARDFRSLRDILDRSSLYRTSSLFGPDVTRPRHEKQEDFLRTFVQNANSVMDAITFHHYYVDGATATLADFTNASRMDGFAKELNIARHAVDQVDAARELWLGEAGSAWGGGAPGLSDTFAAGFLWLDTLGQAAIGGASVVVRQSLYQGHYALLADDLQPNPDFWLSAIFKRFVGERVLGVHLEKTEEHSNVRLYAHCTRIAKRTSAYTNDVVYARGDVTVYGSNLYADEEVRLRVSMGNVGVIDNRSTASYWDEPIVHQYLLRPHPDVGQITSKNVSLNGWLLRVGERGELPGFEPERVSADSVLLPPRSFAFFVFHRIRAPACI